MPDVVVPAVDKPLKKKFKVKAKPSVMTAPPTPKVKAESVHGRKPGPSGKQCGTCVSIYSPSDKTGLPPGVGCRIGRGIVENTPCCDQYEPSGVLLSLKDEREVKDLSGAIDMSVVEKTAGECITSGSLWWDLQVGGGWPGGRVVVIPGQEHSGKTTSVLASIADAVHRAIPTRVFDAEGSQDADYAVNNGIPRELFIEIKRRQDSVKAAKKAIEKAKTEGKKGKDVPKMPEFKDNLLLDYPDFESGDDFYRYVQRYLHKLENRKSGPPQVLFVVDSAAAMTPESVADNPDSNAAAAPARMHAEGFNRIKTLLRRKRGLIIFTNHIGTKPMMTYGNPEYMKGGGAIHLYADINCWIKGRTSGMPHPSKLEKGHAHEKSWTGEGKDSFQFSEITVKKNKVAAAYKKCWIRICYSQGSGAGIGIDKTYDLLQFFASTGQACWKGATGSVQLKIRAPVFKDGELTFPKLKDFYDINMPWRTFRKLVMQPEGDVDLFQIGRMQLASGWAFAQRDQLEGKRTEVVEDIDADE